MHPVALVQTVLSTGTNLPHPVHNNFDYRCGYRGDSLSTIGPKCLVEVGDGIAAETLVKDRGLQNSGTL
jgi:hypothetical protein